METPAYARRHVTYTVIQRVFAPFKRHLPVWAWDPIRRVATAVLTPALFSWRSGHLLSSLKCKAVTRNGEPLPWYTYPSIEFLKHRDYSDRSVLEFGAGQSTFWWAARARRVVAMEGDAQWFEIISLRKPGNVNLHVVSEKDPQSCVNDVIRVLREDYQDEKYDVVVIDGSYREEMIQIALNYVTSDGLIVCDDAESYGFVEGFKDTGFSRVDFFGYSPGVVLPHCTSVFFRSGTFAFSGKYPIPVIARE